MNSRSLELRDQWAAHNPDLDTSSMELVGLIRAISREIDGVIAPLYEDGALKISELGILLRLRYNSRSIIARHLADRMKLTPAAISKVLATLEKRGLITRHPSQDNRRVALVRITDLGKEIIDSHFPQQLAVVSGVMSGLGADRARIVEALQLLLHVIERGARQLATTQK